MCVSRTRGRRAEAEGEREESQAESLLSTELNAGSTSPRAVWNTVENGSGQEHKAA